jgi:hypothetical protein
VVRAGAALLEVTSARRAVLHPADAVQRARRQGRACDRVAPPWVGDQRRTRRAQPCVMVFHQRSGRLSIDINTCASAAVRTGDKLLCTAHLGVSAEEVVGALVGDGGVRAEDGVDGEVAGAEGEVEVVRRGAGECGGGAGGAAGERGEAGADCEEGGEEGGMHRVLSLWGGELDGCAGAESRGLVD